MTILFWTLTILATIIDIGVIYALHRRRAHIGMWCYTLFALLTDIVVRVIPYITIIGEQQPLIPVFCSYILLLTAPCKIMLAVGWFIDYRRKTACRYWLTGAICVGLTYIMAMVVGAIYPIRSIRVQHLEFQYRNLPEAFDGIKIGFFTDIHLGSLTAAERILQQMADSLNTAECLFAINGGDLINIRNSELTPKYTELLGAIDMPVYSVVGNHDLGYYRKDTLEYTVTQSTADFKKAIDALGWIRLDNDSQWIHHEGDSIMITGVEFNRAIADNRHKRDVGGINIDSLLSGVPPETFHIAVSHIPQYWKQIAATSGGDLTLAGHTHAMQFKILGWSPAALLYDWWSGTYTANDKILYVSEGVGFAGIPVRLGTPPQIAIITLRKCI